MKTLDRYVITAVEFLLPRHGALRTDYAGVAEEIAAMGVEATALAVAEAVARLRTRKLPNPAVIGNAGSFFKNPVVAATQAAALKQAHPGLPVYPAADGTAKLSAAWLIEAQGFKGLREGDAGVSAQHALVQGMSLRAHPSSDKALIWATPADYSDDAAGIPETFCVRFPTNDAADQFKSVFNTIVAK